MPDGGSAPDNGRVSRRIVIARDLGELWLALVEDGHVTELSIRADIGARWLGTIAKGRITRLAPGVRAAFVDVGLSRDAFTVMPPGTIAERHLTPGDEILVQVTREAQGGKGHRATFEITLPGWALVLSPGSEHRGVSKRIHDPDERSRLRAILDEITPAGVGLIARTAAVGMTRDELVADRDALLARWKTIESAAKGLRAPAIVHREEDQSLAFVRDHLGGGLDEIVVEGEPHPALADALASLAPGTALRAHGGPWPAIESYGLERALEQALSSEVPLPGGGRLVIQSTEALVAIDVNSGTDTAGEDLEDTALRTNLEAATEIARQVRLRDLAGLIVVDFIDLDGSQARARVNECLAAAFAADRLKSRILPLSEFCLSQITRQRRRLPLERAFLEPCRCCGRGSVWRPEAEARRLLRDVRRRTRPFPNARVRVTAPEPLLTAARAIALEFGAASGLPDAMRLSWFVGDLAVDVG